MPERLTQISEPISVYEGSDEKSTGKDTEARKQKPKIRLRLGFTAETAPLTISRRADTLLAGTSVFRAQYMYDAIAGLRCGVE